MQLNLQHLSCVTCFWPQRALGMTRAAPEGHLHSQLQQPSWHLHTTWARDHRIYCASSVNGDECGTRLQRVHRVVLCNLCRRAWCGLWCWPDWTNTSAARWQMSKAFSGEKSVGERRRECECKRHGDIFTPEWEFTLTPKTTSPPLSLPLSLPLSVPLSCQTPHPLLLAADVWSSTVKSWPGQRRMKGEGWWRQREGRAGGGREEKKKRRRVAWVLFSNPARTQWASAPHLSGLVLVNRGSDREPQPVGQFSLSSDNQLGPGCGILIPAVKTLSLSYLSACLINPPSKGWLRLILKPPGVFRRAFAIQWPCLTVSFDHFPVWTVLGKVGFYFTVLS